MADGIDYNSLIKLAELKIKDEEQYKKIIKAIREISKDIIEITYDTLTDIQNKMSK